MSDQPKPFELHVPDTHIADLRERLAHTRFPDQAPGPAWAYSTDVAWMSEPVNY
jgi:microsomal epoxide hydrolase